jgi:MFS family permease
VIHLRSSAASFHGWILLTGLVLAYAISFLDRQIINLLVSDIRRDLQLNDTEIGLIQGPAFGVFYALFGMPLGWLADRVHRIRLVAGSMALWSVMTMVGGFAWNFESLFVSRIGVGIGEASLVPAAVSLLADTFAPRDRALPLALFTSGVSLGAGLALIAGGALIAWIGAAAGNPIGISIVDDRHTWQSVLIVAGSTGLPLAVAMLFLREPARILETSAASKVTLTGHLRSNAMVLSAMLGGAGLLYIYANALGAWMPTMFERGFNWTPAFAGQRLGWLILPGALLGNVLGGLVARKRDRTGQGDGAMLVMASGAILLAPLAAAFPLIQNVFLAQAGVAVCYWAIALCFGVATAAFAEITPAHLRGRMTALYLMIGNLLGLGLGPPMVGLLIDRFIGYSDEAEVGIALAMTGAATVPAGAALLLLALRGYRNGLGQRLD